MEWIQLKYIKTSCIGNNERMYVAFLPELTDTIMAGRGVYFIYKNGSVEVTEWSFDR